MSLSRTNWSKLKEGWIPYDTAHYRTERAKQIANDIRSKGGKARLGSYVKDYVPGEGYVSYCKIYVENTRDKQNPQWRVNSVKGSKSSRNPLMTYTTSGWPNAQEYRDAVSHLRAAEYMLDMSTDPKVRQIAEEQRRVWSKRVKALYDQKSNWERDMLKQGVVISGSYRNNPAAVQIPGASQFAVLDKQKMYTSLARASKVLNSLRAAGYHGYIVRYRVSGSSRPYYEIIGGYRKPPVPPRRQAESVALNPARRKTIAGNTLTVNGNMVTYRTKDGHVLHGDLSNRFLYEAVVQMAPNRDLGHMWLDRFTSWLNGGKVGRSTMSRDLKYLGYGQRF